MKIAFMFNISPGDEKLLRTGKLGNYFLLNLLPQYEKAGHSIVLISLSLSGKPVDEFQVNENIKMYSIRRGLSGNLSAFLDFRYEIFMISRILKKEKCDVFHAHWCYEYAMAALKTDESKTLITLHDWPDIVCPLNKNYFWKKKQKLGNLVLTKSKYVTSVSPYIKALYDERFVSKRAGVVTNFINPIKLSCITRDLLKFVIISVNNEFTDRKNTKKLMEAFAIVRNNIPNAELWLCGNTYEMGGVAYNWAVSKKLTDGIKFLGPKQRDEAISLIKSADVLVHPSIEESFGMTLIESMIVKTYVIAGKNSGAVPWVLGNGAYGSLVDITNETEIANEIEWYYNNPEYTNEVKMLAYEYVHKTFDVEKIADDYLKKYDELA